MSDDELCDWAKSLIERRAPESSYLDYKETISTQTNTNKIEVAKDVSSFANEKGGVLLYGVPEDEENGVPVAKPLSDCGITISPQIPISIENTLQDIIEPPLPELEIRVLNLPLLRPKQLLMIYHPESWDKPHMVQGYQHGRYYRRGNFRTIIMEQRQIEAAYATRRTAMDHMNVFLERGDFRPIPSNGQFLRIVLLSRFTLVRKQEMFERQFREWLNANSPGARRGEWVAFLEGWSFRSYPSGRFHGKEYEIRLFHNGGICLTHDLKHFVESRTGAPPFLILNQAQEHIIKRLALLYALKYFEYLRISGPLTFQLSLHNVNGLDANVITDPSFHIEAHSGTVPLERDTISFVEESSVDELQLSQDTVLKRIGDRLASAFGISPE